MENNLPYFKFGLRGAKDEALRLLADYPMEARNKPVRESQEAALNAILSNIPRGDNLRVRNFNDTKRRERGYARKIFFNVLIHLDKNKLLSHDGKGYSKSIITFSNKIKRYIPMEIINYHDSTIFEHINDERRTASKIDTEERRELNRRIKRYWDFIKQHDIDHGITPNDFELFNECEVQVFGKPPLLWPDSSEILPYVIYNDRDLTKGGRMYGPFWVGMKKDLRRGITIDGAKTCDIDGKGMHVQLLYRVAGVPLPDGDMYLHTDERRAITKGLMLLMMNTAKELPPEIGRKQVVRTYRNRFGKDEGLNEYILDLEAFHHKIRHLLYKPNWGQLQKTEAGIMLNIMEAAMNENILVLPVHDGCMCKIEHRERVLEIFQQQGIIAAENTDHLKPVPLAETKEFLNAFHKLKKVA